MDPEIEIRAAVVTAATVLRCAVPGLTDEAIGECRYVVAFIDHYEETLPLWSGECFEDAMAVANKARATFGVLAPVAVEVPFYG